LGALDMTAPKVYGASSKTVRAQKGAKSARVTFEVTATDGMDGAVRVSCLPRSGSRFVIGRTTLRCTATDSSGNTGRAAFTVTVKRRR
jgi:HYR domain